MAINSTAGGKGHGRRPSFVPQEHIDKQHEIIFGKKNKTPVVEEKKSFEIKPEIGDFYSSKSLGKSFHYTENGWEEIT